MATKQSDFIIALIGATAALVAEGRITASDLGIDVDNDETPPEKRTTRRKPAAKKPATKPAAKKPAGKRLPTVKLTVTFVDFDGEGYYEITGDTAASKKKLTTELLKSEGGTLVDSARAKKKFFFEDDNDSLWTSDACDFEYIEEQLQEAAEAQGWNLTVTEGEAEEE